MMTNLDRLRFTLKNIEFQKCILFDDVEKLEHILANLEDGQSVHDEFKFTDRIN